MLIFSLNFTVVIFLICDVIALIIWFYGKFDGLDVGETWLDPSVYVDVGIKWHDHFSMDWSFTIGSEIDHWHCKLP